MPFILAGWYGPLLVSQAAPCFVCLPGSVSVRRDGVQEILLCPRHYTERAKAHGIPEEQT